MKEKKTEILNYSSLLPARKEKKEPRKSGIEPLKPAPGSRKKRMRLGRGRSSGKGKTSGKGQKGQKSRQGYSQKRGFEGGQTRLLLRIPKRGFTNIHKKEYQVINLWGLTKKGAAGNLGPDELKKLGLIADPKLPIKILGTGDIKGALNLTVDAASNSARTKIEAAGGKISIRPGRKPAPPKVKKAKKT
ncbi:MAG: 50S ribosomal protein L15, partial [Spirochaetia bacterium]|nr:50S ribosomal protein L15 [Spirochaetia bacterium]